MAGRRSNETFGVSNQNEEITNELQYRVAIRFVIEGDLRFISHHDTMRLFERALFRARWPVRFSKGYNPRPRLSLPLPRAVGITGRSELLLVELDEPLEPAEALRRLREQMPAGLTLTEAWSVDAKHPPQPVGVDYELPLPPDCLEAVTGSLQRLMAAPTWNVVRSGPGASKPRHIDLRQYLVDASVNEGTLRWTARVAAAGSLRPAELLTAVGLDPRHWHHRVSRTNIQWAW